MKVKLQPPSATELAPFNPILPPASITQIMLLANPTKVRDMITHISKNMRRWQFIQHTRLRRRRCVCVTSWLSRSETDCATRLERLTSSPHRRCGVIYSSVQACCHSAETERFVLGGGVCSKFIPVRNKGSSTFSFTFLIVHFCDVTPASQNQKKDLYVASVCFNRELMS